jgi:hypothetical protein
MEYYSALKKNGSMSIAGKWMELEVIMLTEESQAQKGKSHFCSYVEPRPKNDDGGNDNNNNNNDINIKGDYLGKTVGR